MLTDIEIAQSAKLRPIAEIARTIGLEEDDIEPYGRYKAKVHAEPIIARAEHAGRLVLVTGINPTPAASR